MFVNRLKVHLVSIKIICLALLLTCSGCVVVPEKVANQHYQCGLSSDQKTLRLVNLNDGTTNFYQWNDELAAIVTLPTSALISSTYVLVNNIYNIGEKIIKCDK